MSVPIFINTRDRVRDLRSLVEWLEKAGHDRIIFLDNESTYEPLLEYFADTPHTLIRLGGNLGSRALWKAGLVPDEPFVLTDPDVVPVPGCPFDAVEFLGEVMARHHAPAAGLGLFIDDVPADMPSLALERSYYDPSRLLVPSGAGPGEVAVYEAPIDTTFALYPAGAQFAFDAVRTGEPYRAQHLPWYHRPEDLDAEDRYYIEHAMRGPEGTSSWGA